MGGAEEDGREAKEPAAGATPAPARSPSAQPQSEWTASDRRGPLRAPEGRGPDDDVERFVPGSEIDAEGVEDAPAEGSRAAPPHAAPADAVATSAMSPAAPPSVPPAAVDVHQTDAPRGEGTGSIAGAEPSPRRSFWPVAFGVIAGALIGAGSAALVYGRASDAVPPAVAARLAELGSRLDAVEKRGDPRAEVDGVKGRLADLAGRLAALEKRTAAPPSVPSTAPAQPGPKQAAAPPPDAAALAAKVAALQAGLDTVGKQGGSRDTAVKDLGAKLDAVGAALAEVQAAAAAARSNADAVKGRQQDLDGRLGALQAAVGGAQKQAAAAQTGLAAVQGEQKTLAGKLGAPALAVAADSLVAQVEGGRPYAAQVDALATLGADPAKVAVLRRNARDGVASAPALLAKFAPLADPVIATGTELPAGAGLGDRLKHGLFGLADVHRADDGARADAPAADDLPSRVDLIRADLARGDIPGAYGTWAALPAKAKAKSEAWGVLAAASAEAIAVARGLQAASIGSLAAGKS